MPLQYQNNNNNNNSAPSYNSTRQYGDPAQTQYQSQSQIQTVNSTPSAQPTTIHVHMHSTDDASDYNDSDNSDDDTYSDGALNGTGSPTVTHVVTVTPATQTYPLVPQVRTVPVAVPRPLTLREKIANSVRNVIAGTPSSSSGGRARRRLHTGTRSWHGFLMNIHAARIQNRHPDDRAPLFSDSMKIASQMWR
jgi:hypothetical protein